MTLRSLPAMAWTAVIVAICLVPSSWIGTGGEGDGPSLLQRWLGPLLGPIPVDKAIHFGMFAVFAVLWRWAGLSIRGTLAAGLALGAATELGQSIPALQRSTDLDDLLANLVGVVVGLAAFRLVPARQPEPEPAASP